MNKTSKGRILGKVAIPMLLISAMLVTSLSCSSASTRPLADNDTDSSIDLSSSNVNLDNGYISSFNSFGGALFKQLYEKDKNTFISPASAYFALGMTYNGANGDTAKEFEKVFDIKNGSMSNFDQQSSVFRNYLTGNTKSIFNVADAIFIDKSFAGNMDPDFINRDKTFFGSSVMNLDFSDPNSVNIINDWINKNTGGKIKNGVDKLDADSVMNLINAIYFKGEWTNKFESSSDGQFVTSAGTKTTTLMSGNFTGYSENSLYQGIVLPYDDDKTSMVVMLPKKNLSDLVSKVSTADIAAFTKKNLNNSISANLIMPRVNFTYGCEMNSALQKMGLKSAFGDSADFSGMLDKLSDERLSIDKVIQKTCLNIDENGTEAAAMTDVEMKCTAVLAAHVMAVNHPFLVSIVDNKSGAVLFIGTVNDPTQG